MIILFTGTECKFSIHHPPRSSKGNSSPRTHSLYGFGRDREVVLRYDSPSRHHCVSARSSTQECYYGDRGMLQVQEGKWGGVYIIYS